VPIRPENKHRYPADWPQIRERILARAGHRCEHCGVPNYAVITRRGDAWTPLCGSGPADAAGRGRSWPNADLPLTYQEACDWRDASNDDNERYIVVVLTIAHIHDKAPEACDDANLAALCQRCHNRLDAADRAHGRKARAAAAGQAVLL
jgi:5-methylcytosine-specific restriction endonuclease McrA